MQLFLDLVVPMAAIALMGVLLHNANAAEGLFATASNVYQLGARDIRS